MSGVHSRKNVAVGLTEQVFARAAAHSEYGVVPRSAGVVVGAEYEGYARGESILRSIGNEKGTNYSDALAAPDDDERSMMANAHDNSEHIRDHYVPMRRDL
jgi:hypothetical protein